MKMENIPLPNLIHMRSSTMHAAMESQQNAPNFFAGVLKTEVIKIRIGEILNAYERKRV